MVTRPHIGNAMNCSDETTGDIICSRIREHGPRRDFLIFRVPGDRKSGQILNPNRFMIEALRVGRAYTEYPHPDDVCADRVQIISPPLPSPLFDRAHAKHVIIEGSWPD